MTQYAYDLKKSHIVKKAIILKLNPNKEPKRKRKSVNETGDHRR